MPAYLASSSLMMSRESSWSGSVRTVLTFCPEFVLLTRERTLAGPLLATPPVALVDEAGRLPGTSAEEAADPATEDPATATAASMSLCRRTSRRRYSPSIRSCAAARLEKMPSSCVVLTLGSNFSASKVCLSVYHRP